MQFSKGSYCSQGWQLNIHIYRHLPFVCTTFSCCSSTFKIKRKKREEISIHPMLQKEKNERSYVWEEFPRASSSCRRATLKSTAIFVLVLWGVRPLDWRLNGASFALSQDMVKWMVMLSEISFAHPQWHIISSPVRGALFSQSLRDSGVEGCG